MAKRKIRVLVVTFSFPTKHNPTAAIFILNQFEELKRDCEIKVLFPYAYSPKIKFMNPYYKFSQIGKKEIIDGFEVYHPKYLMAPRIAPVRKMLSFFLASEAFLSYMASMSTADRIMKSFNPDIIHIHSSLGEGLIAARLRRKYNKPVVMTVHGEDITKHSKKMFAGAITKFVINNCDAVVCVSKFIENEIRKLGIKNGNFHVISMGGKTDRFKSKSTVTARRTIGLPLNKKIILFVGHLVERKGVVYLIRAMKEIIKKEKDALCIIIGKGIEEESLKMEVSRLELEDYVKLLGQKINTEVADYMNACNILVLPSLNEGLPVVVCEALAAGKPVVATAVAGTPEILTKDVGYLVKPRDVNGLARNIVLGLRRKWSKKKLLRRGQDYSAGSEAKRLVEVYKSLIRK